MALARRGCHQHLEQSSSGARCPKKAIAQAFRAPSNSLFWKHQYSCLRRSATNQDLAALGLSDEDLHRVEGVIAQTQATNVSESIRVLTAYVGSSTGASQLVRQHPNLLCCQLPSWIEFLTAFGMNKAQVQHVLCAAPEALARGDLVRAGESLRAFRRLGLDDTAAAQLITYYPQLLGKGEGDIRALLGLLGRYQTGIDTLSEAGRGGGG